jgi:RimJ/RimL family protein N-acetyltransferase
MIETTRLRLRPLREADAPTIVEELNNFAISRHLARVPFPHHLDDAIDFLRFVATLDERSCMCAVELKSQPDHMIGIISYEFSAEKNDAEFGYWLAELHWRHGIMKEAANAMVRHAFTVSKLETLVSGFHNDNPVSGRILFGLGFEETHQTMNFAKAQGVEVPITKMRLTREKWLGQQKSRGE